MLVSTLLQLKVKEKVHQYLLILLGADVADRIVVTIQFKKNMGLVAGLAYSGKLRIVLNEQLFLSNKKSFLDEIVPHECCHIAQYVLYPDEEATHGKHWKRLMKSLGLKPSVYHDLDVSAVDDKVYRYTCCCSDGRRYHQILESSHKKLQQGKVQICGGCSTRIIYFPQGDKQ